jgi:hypothetical protein
VVVQIFRKMTDAKNSKTGAVVPEAVIVMERSTQRRYEGPLIHEPSAFLLRLPSEKALQYPAPSHDAIPTAYPVPVISTLILFH